MLVEVRKVFTNKTIYICLCSLILLVSIGLWANLKQFRIDYNIAQDSFAKFPDSKALVSPWEYWIGQSPNFFTSFYYFIYPLIVSLPIVDTIFKEKVTGNLNYQLTRKNSFSYFVTKFVFSFIIPFMLFIVPLIIGIVIFNLITGTWDYSNFSISYNKMIHGKAVLLNSGPSLKKEIFSSLLCISPYLYMLNYFLIGGLYAGIYSCFGLAFSLFIKNRYLILVTPMCLHLGIWIIFSLLGLLSWDPFNFLDPRQPVEKLTYLPFVIDFVALFILTTSIYSLGARKIIDVQ
ncbi:NADH dehydrogenase FAD-containing subunit [Pullulanibacillus sp. KACC 23026]|uniref:NADH dehydrogenase FAD-containing subunit n=1 Tax=Pullulanibacillus sp. KACC 23026 TaxID=3028315 RepID=UPI0023B07332|nr:NADH dehydrogenase FAD-containing subunit [Pullulanibacillus sp. KACC 23026]WEG12852.1 NADH dehydrogenase FAD-containing subunit [Pullulanibacillus sp. KACC 23026]